MQGEFCMLNSDTPKRVNLLLKLQSMRDYLNPAEQRITDYILQSPKDVLSMTINQLAGFTDTSYATVTRLVKRYGFQGYKDFKSNLYHAVLNQDDLDTLELIQISQDASVSDVCESSFDLVSNSLEDSHKLLDPNTISQIVDVLLGAKRILHIGSGLSGISAKYAYIKSFRIGLPSIYETDATLYRMQTSLLKKGDVLFAISSSGRTKEIVECAQLAAKAGAYVISLSDYVMSPLAAVSDYKLFTTPRQNTVFLGIDMPFTACQLTVIDAVYLSTCVRIGKSSSEVYTKTKQSANSEKIR